MKRWDLGVAHSVSPRLSRFKAVAEENLPELKEYLLLTLKDLIVSKRKNREHEVSRNDWITNTQEKEVDHQQEKISLSQALIYKDCNSFHIYFLNVSPYFIYLF